ncbi:hypothetical protein ACOME3_010233 [Neoechinorhynchus agilis]
MLALIFSSSSSNAVDLNAIHNPVTKRPWSNGKSHLQFNYISAPISYYYVLIVIVVGCIGNLLTVMIMSRKSMRHVRLRLFIISLCCSDLVFLLTLSMAWYDAHRQTSKWIIKPVVCSVSVYITHVTKEIYTTIFTTRLFIVSNFPLTYAVKRWWASNRFDFHIIMACTMFGLVFYSFAFWFTHVENGRCVEGVETTKDWIISIKTAVHRNDHHVALAVLLVIDSLFTFVLPCGLITFMNASICKILKGSKSKDLRRMKKSYVHMESTKQGVLIAAKKVVRYRQPRITYMLLLRSSAFLLLNAPYNAMLFTMLIMKLSGKPLKPWTYNWFLDMLRLWYFGSFSLNFHLYCTSGKLFRSEVLKMIPFLK